MIRSIAFVVFCAVAASAAPTACARQPAHATTPAATPVRIACTVATPWDPQQCWVEFGAPNVGPKVETASQAEAEELIAILLANPGATYVFDSGATLAGKRGPAERKQREFRDMTGAK